MLCNCFPITQCRVSLKATRMFNILLRIWTFLFFSSRFSRLWFLLDRILVSKLFFSCLIQTFAVFDLVEQKAAVRKCQDCPRDHVMQCWHILLTYNFRPVASNTSPGSCASVPTTDHGSQGMVIQLTPTTFRQASNQAANVRFPMGSLVETPKMPMESQWIWCESIDNISPTRFAGIYRLFL